jgi:hypothetical protein
MWKLHLYRWVAALGLNHIGLHSAACSCNARISFYYGASIHGNATSWLGSQTIPFNCIKLWRHYSCSLASILTSYCCLILPFSHSIGIDKSKNLKWCATVPMGLKLLATVKLNGSPKSVRIETHSHSEWAFFKTAENIWRKSRVQKVVNAASSFDSVMLGCNRFWNHLKMCGRVVGCNSFQREGAQSEKLRWWRKSKPPAIFSFLRSSIRSGSVIDALGSLCMVLAFMAAPKYLHIVGRTTSRHQIATESLILSYSS